MLDVGWTEILVIAIVLIIVVGPKDLPQMLRTFGRMMSKMRSMAGEFRQQFDEALREADLEDVKKTIGEAQKLNPLNTIRDAVNPLRQAGSEIKADLEKAASAVTASGAKGNPTVGAVPTPETTTSGEPAPLAAVPSDAQKPASAEAVASAPLKKGPVGKTATAARKKADTASAAAKPRKAAARSTTKSAAAKAGTAKAAAASTAEAAGTKASASRPRTRKTKKDEA